MRRFLDKLGLISVWDHHQIDYTHVHTDDRTFTTLDHFVCNERILPLITDCAVMHYGDNNSRHSPIMLRLKVGALPLRQDKDEVRQKRPGWYKANETHISNYKADLQGRLEAISVPECLKCSDSQCSDESHTMLRNDLVMETLCAVIESSHATIPMVGGRPGAVRPDSGNMPGWREEVEPVRKDSMFWHAVWQSAGRPVHRQQQLRHHTAGAEREHCHGGGGQGEAAAERGTYLTTDVFAKLQYLA